jgi:hypothetical protein
MRIGEFEFNRRELAGALGSVVSMAVTVFVGVVGYHLGILIQA